MTLLYAATLLLGFCSIVSSLSIPIAEFPVLSSTSSLSQHSSPTSIISPRRTSPLMMPIGVPKVSMKVSSSDPRPYWADLYSRVASSRYLFISQPLTPALSNQLIASLLSLSASSPSSAITLFLNSPGGDLSSALSLIDAMRHVSCPVSTVAAGLVGSASTLILVCGTPGYRLSLPSARIMLAQPGAGARGQCEDIRRAARRVMERAEDVKELLAMATGLGDGELRELVGGRERWMGAEEARRWNLIDGILTEKGTTTGVGKGVAGLALGPPVNA